MRISLFVFASIIAFTTVHSQTESQILGSYTDSLSYALGLNVANSLREENIGDLNIPLMVAAIQQYCNDPTDTSLAMPLDTALTIIMKKYTSVKASEAETRFMQSQEFIQAYIQDTSTQKVSDGVYYRVLSNGKGLSPEPDDLVLLAFEGRLVDGSIFDQSSNYGADMVELAINELIPGLQEIVPLMEVGDSWEVVLSPEKGYGFRNTRLVPSHSALVFELTLRGITRP
jgi:FKBP-type peptidyl-prolyl cis-trans isomerase FklB